MIDKKGRITRIEFPDSRSRRVIFSGQAISISHYYDSTMETNKSCVVVSKKISKKAVIRNRLKRVIYEQVRINSGDFNVYIAGKVVFVPKNIDLPSWALQVSVDIKEFLSKAKYEKATHTTH